MAGTAETLLLCFSSVFFFFGLKIQLFSF